MAYVTLDTGWLTPAQISQASYGVNSPWQNVEKALVNIANDQGVASAYVSGQGFGQTYGMTTDRLEVTGPQPVLNAQADSTVESLQVRLRYRTQSSSARLHWSMEYADASDTFGYFTSFGDLSENADGWVNPTLLLPSTGDSFASIELELFNPTLHPGLRLAADSFKPSSLADPSVGLAVAFAGNQSGSVEIDSIELRMVYHEAGDAPLVSTVDAGTIEALDIGPQIDYAPTSKNILYQSQVSAFTGQRSGSLPRDFDYVDGSPGLQNIARHAAYDGNGNAYVPQGNWDRLFRTAQYGIEYGTPLIPINRLAEVENIGPGEKMNYLFSAFFIETKGSESVLWGLENPHPSYPFTYLPAGGPLALKEDKAFFGEPIGSWNIPDNAELKEIQVKTTLSATKGTWTLDQSLFSATEAYPADAASQSTDVTFDYDLDGVFIKETEQGKLSRFVKQVTHTFPAAAFVDWDTVGYNASGYTNGPGQAWKASGAYASLEQIRTQLSTGNQNPDKNRILVHGLEVTLVWGHLEAEVNAGTVAPEIATLAVTQAFSPSTLDAGTIAPEPAAATLAVSMAATAVAGTIGAEAATLATFDFMVATVDAGTVGPVAAEMLDYRNMETGSGQFGSLELVTATPTFQWSMGSTLDAGSLSSTGLLTMERGDGLTRNSQRFMDLLPPWFSTEAPAVNGLRAGAATVITHIRDVVREARKQMRLSTSSGGYIDLFAADFFGTDLPRRQGEGDASYRTRIRNEIIRPKATREALSSAITDVTGTAPTIIEPQRPADVGSYAWDESPGSDIYVEGITVNSTDTAFHSGTTMVIDLTSASSGTYPYVFLGTQDVYSSKVGRAQVSAQLRVKSLTSDSNVPDTLYCRRELYLDRVENPTDFEQFHYNGAAAATLASGHRYQIDLEFKGHDSGATVTATNGRLTGFAYDASQSHIASDGKTDSGVMGAADTWQEFNSPKPEIPAGTLPAGNYLMVAAWGQQADGGLVFSRLRASGDFQMAAHGVLVGGDGAEDLGISIGAGFAYLPTLRDDTRFYFDGKAGTGALAGSGAYLKDVFLGLFKIQALGAETNSVRSQAFHGMDSYARADRNGVNYGKIADSFDLDAATPRNHILLASASGYAQQEGGYYRLQPRWASGVADESAQGHNNDTWTSSFFIKRAEIGPTDNDSYFVAKRSLDLGHTFLRYEGAASPSTATYTNLEGSSNKLRSSFWKSPWADDKDTTARLVWDRGSARPIQSVRISDLNQTRGTVRVYGADDSALTENVIYWDLPISEAATDGEEKVWRIMYPAPSSGAYYQNYNGRYWVREPSFGSTHVTQRYAGVGNNRSYFPSATLRTPAHLNSYQDLARVTGPYSSGLKLMPQNISRDIVYLRNAVPGSDSSSKRVNYWEESPGAYHRWSNNMSRGRDSKESIVWDGAGEAPGEGETPGTNLVVGRQAGRVGDEILWRYNAGSGVWDGLGAAGQAALVTLAGETDPLAFGPKFSYMTVDRFSNSGGGPYLVRGCGNATGARNQVVTVGFRIDPTSSATIFAPWGHSSSWNNNGGLVYNRTDEEFIYVADPAASWLKDANGYYVIDTNGYYVFDPRFNSGNIVPTLTADGSPPVPAVDYSPFTGSGALPTNVVKWSVPEAELRESTTEGKWCVATIMSNGGVVSLYLNESDKGDRSLPSLTNGWQNNGLQMVSTYQYQIGNNRYAVEGGAPGKMDIAWLAVSSNGSSYWGSQPEPQRKLQHAEANWHLRRSTDTGSRRYWAVDFDGIGDFEGEGLGVAPSAHLQMSSLSVYDADVRIERSAMVAFPESPAVVAADLPTSTMAYGQLGRYASAGMPNQAFVDVTLPKTTEIANVGGLGLSSEVSSAQYQLEVSGAAYGYGVSGSGIWADSEDGDGTVKEAEVNSAIERAKPAGSQVWVRYSR